MARMRSLSATRYKAFFRCLRFYHYKYERLRAPIKKSRALRFGTIFHAALEVWWLSWKDGRAADEALANAQVALRNAAPNDIDVVAWIQLEVLLIGYHLRWTPQMADIEVLAVEKAFKSPLTDPDTGEVSTKFVRGGKMDAICRRDGKLFVVEHKTSSADASAGTEYRTRLRMDPQISIYVDGAEALGYEIEGCIYDVTRKPKLRPLQATADIKYTKGKPCKQCEKAGCEACDNTGWKEVPRPRKGQRLRDETLEEYRERLVADVAEKPEGYYQHIQVVRLDHELHEARRDLWNTAQAMSREIGPRAPRNPDGCFRYGSACEYFDVCSGAASIDDDTRFMSIGKRKDQIAA